MWEISESPTNLVWRPLAKKMNVYGILLVMVGMVERSVGKALLSFCVEQLVL